MTILLETFKMDKIPLNPQNKQNALETFENDKNTPKQSQNAYDFLDFGGILAGFKLFCSFQRILGHFALFSIVEVYILIILDVWGILAVYEVLRFDCLFLPFHGYFGYFRGFRVIFVVLELLRIFWSLKRFRGVYVLHILWFSGYFGDFGSIIAILVISRVFFYQKKLFYP